MDLDIDYGENKEFYDEVIRAQGYEDALDEYEPGAAYDNPFELLEEIEDEETVTKLIEVAEAERILNSNSGSIAGLDLWSEASD